MAIIENIIYKFVVKYRQAEAAFNKMAKKVADIDKQAKTTEQKLGATKKDITDYNASIRESFMNVQKGLMSFGLSMLFTSMAIKKSLEGIAKEAFTTYSKINANTELANNATSRLGMAVDYLKYTLGDALNAALESMLPTLLNLIDNFAEWITVNDELVGKLVLWGIIGSTVGMALGQISLAILGIFGAAAIFKSAGVLITTVLSKIGMSSATVAGTSGLGAIVASVLAVIAIFLLLFKLLSGDETFNNYFSKALATMTNFVIDATATMVKLIYTILTGLSYIGEMILWFLTKSIWDKLDKTFSMVKAAWTGLTAFFKGDTEGMTKSLGKIAALEAGLKEYDTFGRFMAKKVGVEYTGEMGDMSEIALINKLVTSKVNAGYNKLLNDFEKSVEYNKQVINSGTESIGEGLNEMGIFSRDSKNQLKDLYINTSEITDFVNKNMDNIGINVEKTDDNLTKIKDSSEVFKENMDILGGEDMTEAIAATEANINKLSTFDFARAINRAVNRATPRTSIRLTGLGKIVSN